MPMPRSDDTQVGVAHRELIAIAGKVNEKQSGSLVPHHLGQAVHHTHSKTLLYHPPASAFGASLGLQTTVDADRASGHELLLSHLNLEMRANSSAERSRSWH